MTTERTLPAGSVSYDARMRAFTVLAVIAALALVHTGCEERSNMRELPDRRGHAYRTAGAENPLPLGTQVPTANETLHIVQAGDTLRSVGQKYGVSEAWLIRRNRLRSHILEPGSHLIVPRQAASADAKPAAPAAPAAPPPAARGSERP